MMRVIRDLSWRDVDEETVLAGSPLRVLRMTARGRTTLERAESGIDAPAPSETRFIERLVAAGAVHPVDQVRPLVPDDVTVVMPVRGSWPAVPEAARVIIVDDASDPPLAAPPAASQTGAVEIIRLATNVGPAAARNVGIERVTTPIVAFVDSGIDLPDGWLDILLEHFADERVAAVAPRVASDSGVSVLEEYESSYSPLDLGTEPALVAPGARISYVPTAVLVARVDAIREVGGFDPSLRFGEDVDLVWRLARANWRVRYEPRVVAHHQPRTSWSQWWRQRVGYGSSAAPLATRHGRAVAPVRCSVWSLVVWVLVLTGRRVALGAAAGLFVATGVTMRRRLETLPRRETWRLVGRGHLLAGLQLARATRRVWWPLAALVGLAGGRRVRLTIAALLAFPALDAARTDTRGRRPLTVLRDSLIALADDVAYGTGVWKGAFAERSGRALLPEVSAWRLRDADSRPRNRGTPTRG